MSVSVNHVTLAGNLTRDPDLKEIAPDRQVVHFTLANNRRYRTADGESREDVSFIDCEAWGRTATMVHQYLTKGLPALVTGRLKQEHWEDKDGNKRSRIKILVEQVHFLGRPGNDQTPDTAPLGADDGPQASAPAPSSSPRPRAPRPAPRMPHDAPF